MTMQQKFDIDKAEQQFVGYSHAKSGYGAVSLAEAMALTAEEWAILRYEVVAYLSRSDVTELDIYFSHFEG